MFLFPRAAHKISVPAKHADGPVKFQRVRIFKSRPRPLVFTVLALPLTILLLETSEYWLPDDYKKVLQSARAKAEKEKKRASSQHEVSKAQNSADSQMVGSAEGEKNAWVKLPPPQDVSFVLRLPYIRQKHPVPYQKTDKEWVEATKLMNDPARLIALKRLIVEETIKGWARDRPTVDCIKEVSPGKGSKGVESIFDVVVPLHRPPKFEQHALVWLPNGPQLAKIQLSNTTASRILRIWYPEVSLTAFWNAGTVFASASYQIAKHRIQNLGSSETMIAPFSSPVSLQNGTVAPSQSPRKPASPSDRSLDATEKKVDPLMASFFHLAKTLTPETPLAQAKLAFLRTSSAMQIQKLQYVPEGAVVFQGHVAIVGFRGKVKSNVSAIYLPAQDRLILPVIIERTEVLPSTSHWHQVDPREKHLQPGVVLTEDGTSTTAQLEASVDQKAKSLVQRERSMETLCAAETAVMEKSRQLLARDVQKLEELGGKASATAQIQAASTFHYTKKKGPGRVTEVLETLSSTDPHLKRLIEEVASGKPSTNRLEEFGVYVNKSKSIILAQEVERKRGGQQTGQDKSSSLLLQVEKNGEKVEDMKVTEDKKNLGELKDIPSEKNDEVGKSASNSIETTQEGEKGR